MQSLHNVLQRYLLKTQLDENENVPWDFSDFFSMNACVISEGVLISYDFLEFCMNEPPFIFRQCNIMDWIKLLLKRI